jgi:hypothetical protein
MKNPLIRKYFLLYNTFTAHSGKPQAIFDKEKAQQAVKKPAAPFFSARLA